MTARPLLAPPGTAIREVLATDPLARVVLADLEREYDARYGVAVLGEPASAEINRYPAAAFAPPSGAFLVLLRDGDPVSGGALMRRDAETAELKRVWTRRDARGRGYARRILSALELRAASLGYARLFLTTGPRQPEAVALYRAHGYSPLFDPALPAEQIGLHGFEKTLPLGRTATPEDPA